MVKPDEPNPSDPFRKHGLHDRTMTTPADRHSPCSPEALRYAAGRTAPSGIFTAPSTTSRGNLLSVAMSSDTVTNS